MDESSIETSTLSNNSNILVPVDTDKNPLLWDGNDAHIEGLLIECGKYYKRVGLFQPYFAHRAVALGNAKVAVDTPAAVSFITGIIDDDPRSFDDPCPPTSARLTEYAARVNVAGGTPKTPAPKLPAGAEFVYIVAPLTVQAECNKLLRSLTYVFGSADASEDLLEAADGDGDEFRALLVARSKTATPGDKAVVSGTFSKVVREGVRGELTPASLRSSSRSTSMPAATSARRHAQATKPSSR